MRARSSAVSAPPMNASVGVRGGAHGASASGRGALLAPASWTPKKWAGFGESREPHADSRSSAEDRALAPCAYGSSHERVGPVAATLASEGDVATGAGRGPATPPGGGGVCAREARTTERAAGTSPVGAKSYPHRRSARVRLCAATASCVLADEEEEETGESTGGVPAKLTKSWRASASAREHMAEKAWSSASARISCSILVRLNKAKWRPSSSRRYCTGVSSS